MVQVEWYILRLGWEVFFEVGNIKGVFVERIILKQNSLLMQEKQNEVILCVRRLRNDEG